MKNGRYAAQAKELRAKTIKELAGHDVGSGFSQTANRAQCAICCAITDFIATELDNGAELENVVDAVHCGIAAALMTMGTNFSPNGVIGAIEFASVIVSRVGEAIVKDGQGRSITLTTGPS